MLACLSQQPRVRACPLASPRTTLRHHYASVLLAAGESVVAVAERLGHENATLVLKTYGHLMPDSEDRTRRGPSTPRGRRVTAHRRPKPLVVRCSP